MTKLLPDYTVKVFKRSAKTGRLLKPRVKKFKGRRAAIYYVHNLCMAAGVEYVEQTHPEFHVLPKGVAAWTPKATL